MIKKTIETQRLALLIPPRIADGIDPNHPLRMDTHLRIYTYIPNGNEFDAGSCREILYSILARWLSSLGEQQLASARELLRGSNGSLTIVLYIGEWLQEDSGGVMLNDRKFNQVPWNSWIKKTQWSQRNPFLLVAWSSDDDATYDPDRQGLLNRKPMATVIMASKSCCVALAPPTAEKVAKKKAA